MQFQVPQFIDTEDKVVGPLSLKQFLFVGAAAFVCAIFYFFVQLWLFIIATIVLMGGSIAIAFVKVNGQPLIKILTAAALFYWNPQRYIWKSEAPAKPKAAPTPAPRPPKPTGINLEAIASGIALHKSWENLQTGTPAKADKESDRQLTEHKMMERYQIFEHAGGDRGAARRVDYR